MEENKNNESFTYTCSTKNQDEIKAIRQKYIPIVKYKMEKLRQLDRSATKQGTIVSIIVGIIGMAGVALAFPFTRGLPKQREKLAPQIKALSDELLGKK